MIKKNAGKKKKNFIYEGKVKPKNKQNHAVKYLKSLIILKYHHSCLPDKVSLFLRKIIFQEKLYDRKVMFGWKEKS